VIFRAPLQQNPEKLYTFARGHMGDLTVQSFCPYLRAAPLVVAGNRPFRYKGAGRVFGCCGGRRALSCHQRSMMVLFFHAARMALVVFDPYLLVASFGGKLLRNAPEWPANTEWRLLLLLLGVVLKY